LFNSQFDLIFTIIKMLAYILAAILLAATYLAYVCFVRPMKMKTHYARVFRRQGFKVLELPYVAAGAPHYTEWVGNY
jgi:hypothetical protein